MWEGTTFGSKLLITNTTFQYIYFNFSNSSQQNNNIFHIHTTNIVYVKWNDFNT